MFATYSGVLSRPSILNEATPARTSSGNTSRPARSRGLSKYFLSPSGTLQPSEINSYGIRHACAHSPRLADRPPRDSLTSESLGGRSANRGECAQACRMPYELISDGCKVPLGDRKYLLSPRDLAGLEVLPELVRAGVASFKIEGRLKTPEYVANITRVYRKALDELAEGRKPVPAAPGDPRWYEMEMAFSRGLHTGWLGGTNNQQMVHARFGKKRGVYLGDVVRVSKDGVLVQLQGPLKRGDGIVFDAGRPEEQEEGGRIYDVRSGHSQPGGATELVFGRGDIDIARVHVGDKVWKTSDPELDRELRRSFAGETPKYQRSISMEVHGRAHEPLTLLARDEEGHLA